MKKITGIYKITSPSGKVYIGQSVDILNRWKIYQGVHCKSQGRLHRSFIKYGPENHLFEVIHELPIDVDQDIMNKYEQLYMDEYRHCGIELLNIREAGSIGKMPKESREKLSNSRMGRIVTNETRAKISRGHIGKKKPKSQEHIEKVRIANTGKKKSAEAIEKTANKKRGKKLNAEQRKRLSDSHLGQKPWNTGLKMNASFREKLRIANTGKRLTPESIAKREATRRLKGNSGHKGKKHSDETRLKMSEARKKYLGLKKD